MTALTRARREELLTAMRADDATPSSVARLEIEYVDGLPRVPIARSPVTGDVVSRTIDTFGLDGRFWDSDDPVRPFEPVPPDVWAFSGAMALADEIEETDHLVKPGPAVPFVAEHLIRHPGILAVVAPVAVGAHTGFAITYFAEDGPAFASRCNDWGVDHYWYEDRNGRGHDSFDEDEMIVDFDLEPWIAAGKLLWIAPGDSSLRLQNGVTHCPYVGLEGTREWQRVQYGLVWTPSTVADVSPGPAEDVSEKRPRARTRRSTERP